MKKNYKGHKYVPWAVMQRHFYLMSDDSDIEVILTENGGLIHTDTVDIEQKVRKVEKDVENVDYMNRLAHSHFVKLKATFMGKTMIETYPIQDNAYNSPNFYDSNMVNKSIQRAKARLISMITGLGYQLYETGDLQFDDIEPKNKDNIVEVKDNKAPVRNNKNDKKKETSQEVKTKQIALAEYLVENKDEVLPIIQKLNVSFVKQYKKSINLNDSIDDIADVLMNVKNIDLFTNSIKKQHEELNK